MGTHDLRPGGILIRLEGLEPDLTVDGLHPTGPVRIVQARRLWERSCRMVFEGRGGTIHQCVLFRGSEPELSQSASQADRAFWADPDHYELGVAHQCSLVMRAISEQVFQEPRSIPLQGIVDETGINRIKNIQSAQPARRSRSALMGWRSCVWYFFVISGILRSMSLRKIPPMALQRETCHAEYTTGAVDDGRPGLS